MKVLNIIFMVLGAALLLGSTAWLMIESKPAESLQVSIGGAIDDLKKCGPCAVSVGGAVAKCIAAVGEEGYLPI